MKKFKSKNRNKKNIKPYIILIILSFIFRFIFLNKENHDKIILLSINSITNKVSDTFNTLLMKVASPENIIYASLNKNVKKNELSVFKETDDEYNYENTNTSYVEDPNPVKITKPLIYLYNTHQLEEYSSLMVNDYNVRPNVLMASYMLKEKLLENEIPTIVETANIKKYIQNNGWKYNKSYKASRHFLELSKNKNPSLKYFIDIHRDSLTKDKTTLVHNNKKYAKIMFVVGIEHNNYKKNLELASDLNYKINMKLPGISRGISKKGGRNVNGIYNQDLSQNALLIEVGGIENTIEEIYNTMEVIALVLSETIRSLEWKKEKNPVLITLGVLFIIYLSLFISQSTGYYELKQHNKMMLTNESMKRFEEDIKNGKDISINDYVDTTKKDYSSKVGDIGNKTSTIIQKIMTKGIKTSFGMLGKLLG